MYVFLYVHECVCVWMGIWEGCHHVHTSDLCIMGKHTTVAIRSLLLPSLFGAQITAVRDLLFLPRNALCGWVALSNVEVGHMVFQRLFILSQTVYKWLIVEGGERVRGLFCSL